MPSPMARLAGADAEMAGKRLFQLEIFRIVVFPDLVAASPMAVRTEGAGPKPLSLAPMRACDRTAALSLDRFGSDKGNGGGKGRDEGRKAGKCGHAVYRA